MLIMLITVDFEKMIEDDHEHCCGAEEEGEGVEGGVGDHFFCCFCFSVCLWEGIGLRGGAQVFGGVVVWFGLVVVVVDWCGCGGGVCWVSMGNGRTIKLARA